MSISNYPLMKSVDLMHLRLKKNTPNNKSRQKTLHYSDERFVEVLRQLSDHLSHLTNDASQEDIIEFWSNKFTPEKMSGPDCIVNLLTHLN